MKVAFKLSSHLDDGNINPILELHKKPYHDIVLPYYVPNINKDDNEIKGNEYAGIARLSDDLPRNYDGKAKHSIEFEKLLNGGRGKCMYDIIYYIILIYCQNILIYRFGLHHIIPKGSKVRFSMWIKFVDNIPSDTSAIGFGCQGKLTNNWISECQPNEWKHVSVTVINKVGYGDWGRNIFRMTTLDKGYKIRWIDFKMEFEEVIFKDRIIKTNANKYNKEFIIAGIRAYYDSDNSVFKDTKGDELIFGGNGLYKESEINQAILLTKMPRKMNIIYIEDLHCVAGIEFDDFLIAGGCQMPFELNDDNSVNFGSDNDMLSFKEIWIQNCYYGGNFSWLCINYMKLIDTKGNIKEIGRRRPNGRIQGEFKGIKRYYDNITKIYGNNIVFTGVLLSKINVIGLQFADINGDLTDDNINKIYRKNDSEKHGQDLARNNIKSILYGEIICSEKKDVIKTLIDMCKYSVISGPNIIQSIEPLYQKLVEKIIYSKDTNIIYSIFRVYRYLCYIESNKEYKSIKLNNNDNIDGINYLCELIKLNSNDNVTRVKFLCVIKLWKLLYDTADECLNIINNETDFNIYSLTYFKPKYWNYIVSYATAFTQLFMFGLIITHIPGAIKELNDNNHLFTDSMISILLALLITFGVIYIVKKQIKNTITFIKAFPDSKYHHTTILSYIVNVFLAILIVPLNIIVVSTTIEALDLVLNCLAMLFILELDDNIVDIDEETESNIIYTHVFTKLTNKLDIYSQLCNDIKAQEPYKAKALYNKYFYTLNESIPDKQININSETSSIALPNESKEMDKIDQYMLIYRSHVSNGNFHPDLIIGYNELNKDIPILCGNDKIYYYKDKSASLQLISDDVPTNTKYSIKYNKYKFDSRSHSFFGFSRNVGYGSTINVSFWIKFIDNIPSINNGVSIIANGLTKTKWMRSCNSNTWKQINIQFVSKNLNGLNTIKIDMGRLKIGNSVLFADFVVQFDS